MTLLTPVSEELAVLLGGGLRLRISLGCTSLRMLSFILFETALSMLRNSSGSETGGAATPVEGEGRDDRPRCSLDEDPQLLGDDTLKGDDTDPLEPDVAENEELEGDVEFEVKEAEERDVRLKEYAEDEPDSLAKSREASMELI